MLPADPDGATLPPANAPAPLIEVDDNAWDPVHFPVDRLDVWNATIELGAGRRSLNVTHEGVLPTASFDGILCNFGAVRPAAGHVSEARHARRPAHVPHGLSELR